MTTLDPRGIVPDDELEQWAALRADDAGRLARELLAYRRASPQPSGKVEALREAANIAFDEMFKVTGAPVARAVQQKILALAALSFLASKEASR